MGYQLGELDSSSCCSRAGRLQPDPHSPRGPQVSYMLLSGDAGRPGTCRPQTSLSCHERHPLSPAPMWTSLPHVPCSGKGWDPQPHGSVVQPCQAFPPALQNPPVCPFSQPAGTSAASEGSLSVPVTCQSECVSVCGRECKCMTVLMSVCVGRTRVWEGEHISVTVGCVCVCERV